MIIRAIIVPEFSDCFTFVLPPAERVERLAWRSSVGRDASLSRPCQPYEAEEALRRSRDGTSPMPRHLVILEVNIVPVAAWAAPKGGGVGGPSTAAASLPAPAR